MDNSIFLNVHKGDEQALIGIGPDNPNYYKVAFVNDDESDVNFGGCAIITRGKRYINCPFDMVVMDTLPTEQLPNTLYLIKEGTVKILDENNAE